MFLIDKYNYLLCESTSQQKLINNILNSFNSHNNIYNNIYDIINKPINEFKIIVNELERCIWKYSNFQHLIIYGSINSNKEQFVNLLLENIYGKNNIILKNVEYIINGYGDTKTKVNIKQSKYHIIIEPNSNGFDKYLIHEIIQNYAKTESLNILKYKKLFKIVIINKLDNLSYYAQASLRRTMEIYSDTCKFIFICDQLSKINEQLRSRCIMLRVPLPTNEQILDIILKISNNEHIKLEPWEYNDIIKKSEYKINTAIWLLELKKNNLQYKKTWEEMSFKIVDLILNKKNYNNNKCYSCIKKIREIFYLLFITNIPTQIIIKNIMINLLENVNDMNLKNNIIEITSIFELRLSQGTRQIIHFEAYCIRLIYLFNNYFNNISYKYDLDLLEI
jgi:replication factor C subunit 3/5